MAYIGIGFSGEDDDFLREVVRQNHAWLSGDRVPRFYGDRFLVMYDTITAREFAKVCLGLAPEKTVTVYPMERPLDR